MRESIFFRTLQSNGSDEAFVIGVDVFKGKGIYANTNFVILTSRYEIFNQTSYLLHISQFGNLSVMDDELVTRKNSFLELNPQDNYPFHWSSFKNEKKIFIRIPSFNTDDLWSDDIQICKKHSTFINVRNIKGHLRFLRLETVRYRAKYFLVFMNAENFPPPIRIDNYASVSLQFYQPHDKNQIKYPIKPYSSKSFVLRKEINDDDTLILEAPGGNVAQCILSQFEDKKIMYENFIYIEFAQHVTG